jgi:hypothetical protein
MHPGGGRFTTTREPVKKASSMSCVTESKVFLSASRMPGNGSWISLRGLQIGLHTSFADAIAMKWPAGVGRGRPKLTSNSRSPALSRHLGHAQ